LEIYQLRAFVAVARLGNVTRAAESLHVTQPAVTAQIKALEEELGVNLFDRRPGRIVLTRTGELLLPDAEQMLSIAGTISARAREFRGEVTGLFVIGTVGDPDSLRLGSLLTSLVGTLPLLDIKTRSGHSEELRELVAAESLHAAFYIGPNVPQGTISIPLQTLHYRVAAPPSFRSRLENAGWRDIADMPWIGAPPKHHAQVLVTHMFARQGLAPHFALEADEHVSPHCLVSSGLGLALLREDVALAASERDEILIWPHARVAATLSFIYPSTAEHDPAAIAAVSQVRSVWGQTQP